MKATKNLVLVVDDDEGLRELAETICRQVGLETRSAADTVEAREYLQKNTPDLILLDIMMPDGNGLEFCRWLRSRPELKDVLIIVQSALEGEEVAQDALEMGAVDFIKKPYAVDVLKDKLHRLLPDSGKRAGNP